MLRLRAATGEDVRYLMEVAEDPQVARFLSPPALVQQRLESQLTDATSGGGPEGLFVIEASGTTVGGLVIQLVSRHSRICELTTLMVDPAAQRSGIGGEAVTLACRRVLVEHAFHRVQAETYGDNRGAQRLFERVGFVREGARRRAYWRRDQWLDGVLYGLLAEELRDADGPGRVDA